MAPSPTNSAPCDDAILGEVAEEFFDQLIRGKNPNIEQYVQQHPEFAEYVRDIFPALELIKHSTESTSQSVVPNVDPAELNRLGDYQILGELGRGGMGVVYEAHQISLNRRVALKVLPFAAAMDTKQLARFKTEAQAAASLDHPNIVDVYAVGCERSVHFYAMRYIQGQSAQELISELRQLTGVERCEDERGSPAVSQLARDLSQSRVGLSNADRSQDANRTVDFSRHLPPAVSPSAETKPKLQAAISTQHSGGSKGEYYRNVASFGGQAADALDHAHTHGILHRDIKPGNLMVDTGGKLWVTDFGLARIEADVGMTMTGDILGTLRYMSPEQALAKRVVVDHRSDIYSLGVTLYELLSLLPAYAADDRQALLKQIAFEEPLRLRQLDHRIPIDLETIVGKAIEKNPADRYETAEDLADDLQRFLDNEAIRAKPPTLRDRAKKWSQRHVAAVRVVATCCLLLSVVASWLLVARSYRVGVAVAALESSLLQAVAAMDANESELAQVALSAAKAQAGRVGDAGSPLQRRIITLQYELTRYEKFAELYLRARYRRRAAEEGRAPAKDALALYDVRENATWRDALNESEAPQEFTNRVAEQVYEMLVLLAQDMLMWDARDARERPDAQLTYIDEARSLLKLSSQIREPTKGYYWALATCSQLLGNLTEGAVRDHHDAEAIRLRAIAEKTPPQNAAELFYIARDRRFGVAAAWRRPPFNDPYSGGELLAAYQEMLRVEPGYYNALFFSGLFHAEKGNHEAAVQAFNGCLAVRLDDTMAINNRADSLRQLGLLEDAAVDAFQAVEIAREQLAKDETSETNRWSLSFCLETLGEIQRDSGDRENALSRLRESLGLRVELAREYPDRKLYEVGRAGTAKILASLDEEESQPEQSDEAAELLNEKAVE